MILVTQLMIFKSFYKQMFVFDRYHCLTDNKVEIIWSHYSQCRTLKCSTFFICRDPPDIVKCFQDPMLFQKFGK